MLRFRYYIDITGNANMMKLNYLVFHNKVQLKIRLVENIPLWVC